MGVAGVDFIRVHTIGRLDGDRLGVVDGDGNIIREPDPIFPVLFLELEPDDIGWDEGWRYAVEQVDEDINFFHCVERAEQFIYREGLDVVKIDEMLRMREESEEPVNINTATREQIMAILTRAKVSCRHEIAYQLIAGQPDWQDMAHIIRDVKFVGNATADKLTTYFVFGDIDA